MSFRYFPEPMPHTFKVVRSSSFYLSMIHLQALAAYTRFYMYIKSILQCSTNSTMSTKSLFARQLASGPNRLSRADGIVVMNSLSLLFSRTSLRRSIVFWKTLIWSTFHHAVRWSSSILVPSEKLVSRYTFLTTLADTPDGSCKE